MKRQKTPRRQFAAVISTALALVNAPPQAIHAATGDTLEEVIVTAQRMREQLEAEQALTPGAVTVVDGADLYQRSVTNLADMLRYVPGVWSESASGADELFFSSRGSNLDATDYDKNGIKLLQDGLPVTTADGNNHNRVVDPLSARYVVVARGANALTYGASTLGGGIDFVSPTARTTAPLSVFVNGGSHGLVTGRISAGAAADVIDGLATIEAKSWDGYRDHSAQDRAGAYANVGWRMTDEITTRVYATYVDNDEELPGGLTRAQVDEDPDQANPSAITGNFQKNVETARIAAKMTWQINQDSSLQAGLSYEEQSLYHPIVDVRIDFDGPGPGLPVQVFSLLVDTDHRDLGAMLRYDLKLGEHNLLAGVNYGDGSVEGGNYGNDAGHKDGLSEIVDHNSDSLEAFLVDRWRLTDAWTLVYGAQVVDASRDVRTIDAAGGAVRNPKDDYSAFNPRAGVIYALSDTSEAFASVSRVFEAPTTFEMEDDVRGGNATLDPMEGTVYEVGIRGNAPLGGNDQWHWDVAVYYGQIRDEILSVDNPAAPGNSLTTNIDKTIHAGVEALVGASIALAGGRTHRIEPLVSVTLNDFSFDSDAVYGDNDLPAAPDYAVRGELLYRNANGFYVGPTFDLVGERYADFTNTYRVDSYELLGLRTGYSGKRWEIFGELRNLLDEDHIATVGVLNQASPDSRILYPGAPRSAYVGARLEF
jgi:iron complex outermembrane receptor protein